MRRPPPHYELTDGTRYAPSRPTEFFSIRCRLGLHGLGAYTEEFIREGAVVLRDGGLVIENPRILPRQFYGYQAMVDEKVYLSPPDHDDMAATWYINHSCNPNLARYGGLIYVARRDLHAGDELTVDYAPFVAARDNWVMVCRCQDAACRKQITSRDWRDPVLAEKLWPEWLPFIQRRIERLKATGR